MLIWYRGFQCNSQWLDRYCRYWIQLAAIQQQQHIEKQSQTVLTHEAGGSNGCWYRLCVTTLSNQTHQQIDSERLSRKERIKGNTNTSHDIKSNCFNSGPNKKAYALAQTDTERVSILADFVWASELTLPARVPVNGDCRIGQGSERSLSVTAPLQRARNHSNTAEQSKHTPPIFNFFH